MGADPGDTRSKPGRTIAAFRSALGESQPLAYAEMVAGLGILVALNLLLFRDDPGFKHVDPHPFWLVILPIAIRYGALPGYAVGALSAVVYVALVLPQAGASLSPASIFGTQVLLDPVLFLLVGAALGELRESHKRSHKRLAAKYDEVEAGLQDLAQRYLAALELSRELERRIDSQTSSVMTLYQAAKALEDLDIQGLPPSILELTATFIDAEACALYLRQNERFVLEAARPDSVDFDRPKVLDTGRGLPSIVVAERRTATVRDTVVEATPARIMSERLLMATPLLSEDQEVMGILVVEKMPFLRFTPAAVKLFTLLGDWASRALHRALRFQQTQDRNIEDELTGAYNYSYVTKRLDEETARAQQYGLPLSVVALRVDGYEEILPVRLPGVLRTMSLVFRHHIRPIDILGRYSSEDVFLMILPHLGLEEGRALAARIAREVAAFAFKPFDHDRDLTLSASSATFTEDTPDAEALVEEVLRSLNDPDRTDLPRGKPVQ
ncbi:MAG: GGDEF domain-containing protein [Actinomycetota bacterium]|nr:GGDEF domain-containing protein [Actinomycetota bacterium]